LTLSATCHITQLSEVEPFDSKCTPSIMTGYQRSSHSTQGVLPPRITAAISAVTTLLHADMLSNLFVSWVEDMLVLIKS